MFQGQVCKRCVMDESDPMITFDSEGICNHCHQFEIITKKEWFPNAQGEKKLQLLLSQIRENGKGKKYDCILGLSGGVDSSYLVLKLKKWGLRVLLVHVDAGWNTEIAQANVETLAKYSNYELYTYTVNWNEMKRLQLAYLKSGVLNQDVPQDHIFFSVLYSYAVENNIQYVIHGSNIATESILPKAWGYPAMDSINIKNIYNNYNSIPLREYRLMSFYEYYIKYPFIKKMKIVRPLNLISYNKNNAIQELINIGWTPYERKHGESIFTKLYQNYYLPKRFGYDKRKPHLSSLIVSGQITRDMALEELEKPLYDPIELKQDIESFCKKMDISLDEFNDLMKVSKHNHSEYGTWDKQYIFFKNLYLFIKKFK